MSIGSAAQVCFFHMIPIAFEAPSYLSFSWMHLFASYRVGWTFFWHWWDKDCPSQFLFVLPSDLFFHLLVWIYNIQRKKGNVTEKLRNFLMALPLLTFLVHLYLQVMWVVCSRFAKPVGD
jgi:hypothetical protein